MIALIKAPMVLLKYNAVEGDNLVKKVNEKECGAGSLIRSLGEKTVCPREP